MHASGRESKPRVTQGGLSMGMDMCVRGKGPFMFRHHTRYEGKEDQEQAKAPDCHCPLKDTSLGRNGMLSSKRVAASCPGDGTRGCKCHPQAHSGGGDCTCNELQPTWSVT